MFTITLCGSARFEQDFIDANRELTLLGNVVIGLSVLPSQAPTGEKNWYDQDQKEILDLVHLQKVSMADAIVVVGDGYIGESTAREILWADLHGIPIFRQYICCEETENGSITNWVRLNQKLRVRLTKRG